MLKGKRFLFFGARAVLKAVSASLTLSALLALTALLAVSASLTLTGCSGEGEGGGEGGREGAGEGMSAATAVTDLILTDKIPAPVTDAPPIQFLVAIEYVGTVTWSVTAGGGTLSGNFQPGTAYTATVTLVAVSNYAFKGTPAFAHTHAASGPSVSPNSDGTVTVTIDFPATVAGTTPAVVTDLDLTDKVPAPVTDAPPIQFLEATQYTGTVVWSVTEGGVVNSGNFQPDTAYTATARLTAVSGYAFKGTVFAHTGAASGPYISPNSDGTVAVTINFPATAPIVVTDLDLTDKVPAPVKNAPPAQTVAASQYAGPVAWSVTGGSGVVNSGNFQPDTAYTATARLIAVPGYAFASAPAFTHAASVPSVSPNGDGTVTVTMNFPATAAVAVTDLDLTGKIPA
ncbi:MAG: hypothetical protein LBL31_03605, partial [Spirochaetaceae bacterium]|nr:hypothetical protein [Spirochaetaceae bacterium]